MRSIASVIVVSSLAFVGTMFDNFFAFGTQLVLTEKSKFRRVSQAQAWGVATLVTLAAALGFVLDGLPLRWIGLLCVLPFAFAWHGFRHRSTPREQHRRGAVTTFALTLSLGGDNLAVWIPIFRANGLARALLSIATFAFWEMVFLFLAQLVAGRPRVVSWGQRFAPMLVPYVYLALGVLILIECRTFS